MIDKSIREIVRRCRPHMWAAAALFFACYLADVVLITCVAYALTTIIYPQQPVLWVIAPILLVVAVRCALRMLSLSQCSKVSSMVELELSERITEKLTRLSWTRVAERREREFVWCARKGATCIGDLLGNVVPVAVGTLGLVIVILIGGLYLGWRMPATLLAFVVAVVALSGAAYFLVKRELREKGLIEAGDDSGAYFDLVVKEADLLRDYRVGEDFAGLAAERNSRDSDETLMGERRRRYPLLATLITSAVGLVTIVYTTAFDASFASANIVHATSMILYTCYGLLRVSIMAFKSGEVAEAEEAALLMADLLSLRVPDENGSLATVAGDHLSANRLAYSYDGEEFVLKSVTIDVPAVGLTAVVGVEGSGKSTLAGVLAGHLRDYRGNVLLGGKQLRDVLRTSRLRYITYVGIDSELLSSTVRENLLMGDPAATEGEMWSVLSAVGLDSECRRRGGLDFELVAGGTNVSRSERLRLALARAVLHNTPIIIIDGLMDEINPVDQRKAMLALRGIARFKAVVVLTRYPVQAQFAKVVYLLSEGAIIASGSHEELMASYEPYRSACEQQERLLALEPPQSEAVDGAEHDAAGDQDPDATNVLVMPHPEGVVRTGEPRWGEGVEGHE